MRGCSKPKHGLAWTAHPRIKASSWAPDVYRDEDFLSRRPLAGRRLEGDAGRPVRRPAGRRACSTCSTTWPTGASKKYVPGEVDVFKIDHTHELYGHMNVNYLRLDRLPDFDERLAARPRRPPRRPVLRHHGRGADPRLSPWAAIESGATLALRTATPPLELRAEIEWTFPPAFAEVISGDGKTVYRERIDLVRHSGRSARRRWICRRTWGEDLGPVRGVGRGVERGVYAAGLDREVRRVPRRARIFPALSAPAGRGAPEGPRLP